MKTATAKKNSSITFLAYILPIICFGLSGLFLTCSLHTEGYLSTFFGIIAGFEFVLSFVSLKSVLTHRSLMKRYRQL